MAALQQHDPPFDLGGLPLPRSYFKGRLLLATLLSDHYNGCG